MIAQIVIIFILAYYMDRFRSKRRSRIFLILSLVIGVGVLAFFKYIPAMGIFGALSDVVMPIGISFYTFQILSYVIDLYRGRVSVSKNILNFACYVTLFPQLIAGPIVRYADVESSLQKREHSAATVSDGICRFVIGLGKKVLIANIIGDLYRITGSTQESSVLFAWLSVIAFTLQIYYDFSGYSDMAIGLGQIFGFTFLENFNYPYISKSITEFWRRWHISMSSWFRDYVYFPLGGSHVPKGRHICNILFVWALTGLWHGARWNFVAWELYFALLLLLEKYLCPVFLTKLPRVLRHIYVLLLIMIGWILFESSSFTQAATSIKALFGFGTEKIVGAQSLYYLRSYIVILGVAMIGATPFPKKVAEYIRRKRVIAVLEPLVVAGILLTVTAFLVDGSFNPFLYFRF
jgi:alginate O-acetyltransferase complex protein AlgI